MSEVSSRLSAALAAANAGYRIERELGAGGMATVWLAHDERHDRHVALKVLKPELAAVIGAERFLNEIKTTANLQHPHILPLHDSGEVDGTVWYVMPFVEGESLRDRLARETQLPVDDAIAIAREVASALDYAHRHGVIHRDIKPENILLHDGRAVVADFGIALAVSRTSGGTRLTETGMSLGTPHYMSPEQALGEKTIDARTDVYALGAVLYEMLVGEPPFTGPSAQAIIAKVMNAAPTPISTLRPTVPAAVEAAVMRALSKLPADRFKSAAEFAGTLQAGSSMAPTATHATMSRPVIVQVPRAMRFVPWLIAAGGLAAAGVLAVKGRGGPDVRVTAAVIPLEIRIPNTAPLNEVGSPIAISPDGSFLVYVGPDPEMRGATAVWKRPLDRLEAAPIAGTRGALMASVSDDAQSVFFWVRAPNRTGNVRMAVPIEGGIAQAAPGQGLGMVLLGDTVGVVRMPDGTLSPRKRDEPAPEGGQPLGWGIASTVAESPDGELAIVGAARLTLRDTIFLFSRTDRRFAMLALGASATFLDNRTVAFRGEDGALRVGRLDASRARFERPPIAVIPGVAASGTEDAIYAVANDGTLIYQAGSTVTTARLVWVRPDGGEVPIRGSESRVYGGVALSPDGRRAVTTTGALNAAGDLWLEDFVAGTRSPLTTDGESTRPVWRPDGTAITYIRGEGRGSQRGGLGVYEVPLGSDARPKRLLAPVDIGYAGEFHWAPDLRSFVMRVTRSGGRDIVAYVNGATAPVSIAADSGAEERGPRFSPDGRWLLYVSDRTERDEVYAAQFPSGGSRVQISAEGGREAVWSHDGSKLFYRAPDGWMMSATIVRGATLAVARRDRLFDASAYHTNQFLTMYDVAPDGRFLMLRRDAAAPRIDIIVIRNWVQQIMRQLDQGAR